MFNGAIDGELGSQASTPTSGMDLNASTPTSGMDLNASNRGTSPNKTVNAEVHPAQRLIALTGGIGSGKTQVSDYLESLGVPVADADRLVHDMLRNDTELLGFIREQFGSSVFAEDGTVNRKALGAVIFQDVPKRKLLESWTHPRVRAGFLAFRKTHPQAPILVEVIPLLFESALETMYPEVWLVASPESQVLQRLQEKRGFNLTDAQARLKSQLPLAEKEARLKSHPNGHVIENTTTLSDLFQQVDCLLS